jgi:hypothetical protein
VAPLAHTSWQQYYSVQEAKMHGPATILILAKKKAGGGGYFDPMADAEMAMGPMEYEEEEGEKLDLGKMDFREAATKLREIASQLEKSSVMHGEQAKTIKAVIGDEMEEDESTDEAQMPEPPKAKRSAPAFLKPKPMKY